MDKKLLKTLQDLEAQGVYWGRSGTGLYISTSGYIIQLHMDADNALRKLKLKYDFDKGLSKFDKVCGRTFTYYKDVYK